MLLPSTYVAAVVLLLISCVCLGSWPNTFKVSGSRWRFELYYLDFAIGALAAAALMALTFGTLGSELSFSDRIAVAGLRSQALAVTGGFVFSIGNMLLLAAVSLLGLAGSFPFVFAIGLVVGALASFSDANPLLLIPGFLVLLGTAVTVLAALRARVVSVSKTQKQPGIAARKRTTKGLIAAGVGGLFIGGSYPIADTAFWGDLGLGAYGGVLMFCVGIVISTAFFTLFLMNIAIEGPPLTPRSYLQGDFRVHALGLAGGAIWAAGTLAGLLARSAPPGSAPSTRSWLLWDDGSVLVAMFWGIVVWGEFGGTSRTAKLLIALTALLFGGGLLLIAFRSNG